MWYIMKSVVTGKFIEITVYLKKMTPPLTIGIHLTWEAH